MALRRGVNLVGVAALQAGAAAPLDGAGLLRRLASEAPVPRIVRLDPATGRLAGCSLIHGGQTAGEGCVAPIRASEAAFVLAEADASLALALASTAPRCDAIDLAPGTHLVALPCAAPGLDAHTLLAALGPPDPALRLDTHDAAADRWTGAAWRADRITGPAFPIGRATGLLITLPRALHLAPPRVDAGPDRSLRAGTPVPLTASAIDPDLAPAPLALRWHLTAPPGSRAALDDPESPTPALVPDVPGLYTLTLRARDGLFEASDDVVLRIPDAAPAHVRGHVFVFAPDGGLLPGAEISILELPGFRTLSGPGGAFELRDVPPGPVTLVLSHPTHTPTQTGTLWIEGTDLDRVTLQTPPRLLFELLANLLGVVPDPVRCQIASTVTRWGASLYGPDPTHGDPGARVTIDPPLPPEAGPIYFAQLGAGLVLPDRSLTQTSEDGGVLFVNVPPGEYTLRAHAPGRDFTSARVQCRPGMLVNPSPPRALQSLTPPVP